MEELGIEIGAVQPWKVEIVDYEHARVRLHFCKVFDWAGAFEMRERQAMAWQDAAGARRARAARHLACARSGSREERGFVGATTLNPR